MAERDAQKEKEEGTLTPPASPQTAASSVGDATPRSEDSAATRMMMMARRRGRGGGGEEEAVKAAPLVGAHPFLAGRLKMKSQAPAPAPAAV